MVRALRDRDPTHPLLRDHIAVTILARDHDRDRTTATLRHDGCVVDRETTGQGTDAQETVIGEAEAEAEAETGPATRLGDD